ncbi:hypothetical protein GGF50DRAFT_96775, partial [Schizophyllum commune]
SPRHARQPLFAPGVGYRPCHALLSVLLCFLVFLLSPYATHSLLRFLVMLITAVYLLSWRYASARARRRAPQWRAFHVSVSPWLVPCGGRGCVHSLVGCSST